MLTHLVGSAIEYMRLIFKVKCQCNRQRKRSVIKSLIFKTQKYGKRIREMGTRIRPSILVHYLLAIEVQIQCESQFF